MPQHGFGQIEPDDRRLWITLGQHAREPALAASHIQHALAVEVAEIIQDKLDVVNPRIDGGREILFVGGRFVEVLDDLTQGNVRQLYPLPKHQPRVRKIGSPVLLA